MKSYTSDQLRDVWAFCQHDFDRFIELLEWLDKLRRHSIKTQIMALKTLRRTK